MFSGSMVALVTPMVRRPSASGDSQIEIDWSALSHLIDWHVDSNSQGLIIAGTTGESGTLSLQQRYELIERSIAYARGRIPVIVGTYANSTQQAVANTLHAQAAGADAALIMTPAYIKPTIDGLVTHYRTIANATTLPIIVYNVPSRTACDCVPEVLAALREVENIIGIKDATADMERFKALKAAHPELKIYSGDDETAAQWMLAGGDGVISVTANVVPQQVQAMCEAAIAGRHEQVANLLDTLTPLNQILFAQTNPIPVKWLTAHIHNFDAVLLPPLTPLSPSVHDRLLACYNKVMA